MISFKHIGRSVIIVFSVFSLHGFTTSSSSKLTIKITNIKNTNGEIEIGLYDKNSEFPIPNKQLRKVRRKIFSSKVVYTFVDLPHGDYALAIYHDENKDKMCNKNFFGVPTEAYAFSKNFRPWYRAPRFDDCAITLDRDRTITIKMIY